MNAPDWLALIAQVAVTAQATGVPMVVGWQQNDDTGENEPGFCPAYAPGPAFVHTPVAIVRAPLIPGAASLYLAATWPAYTVQGRPDMQKTTTAQSREWAKG